MHEVGMAFDIVSIVDGYAEQHGIESVRSIGLDVGEYSGVIPDALRLGFESAAELSERCRGAQLEIRIVEGSVRCADCGAGFHIEAPGEACPRCGSHSWSYEGGREFKITTIGFEREEPEPEAAPAAATRGGQGHGPFARRARRAQARERA